MKRNGQATKDRILEESRKLILANGYAGTSLDQILESSKITKGAFFYHFRSKSELAMVLMQEYASADMRELNAVLSTVQAKNDPKERLLGFVQSFVEGFADLETPYPGCLYASVTNESNLFDHLVREVVMDAILAWRKELIQMIDETKRSYKPIHEVDVSSIADMFTVILEGAYMVSKALNEPSLTSKQLSHYRDYLDLLFIK